MSDERVAPGSEAEMTKLERVIGVTLHAGVVSSSICLAAGLALEIAGAGAASRLLLNVGLVVLIATPVSRVVISVVEYAAARDWVFVVLTAVVLLELAASLWAALT